MEACQVKHFFYNEQDFIHHVVRSKECDRLTELSIFDNTLRSGWTKKMQQGLFRYTLADLRTRILPGSYGFVAQLNILRGQERRKPQRILSIRQQFDAKQFNFNKINPEEIIFEMKKRCVDTEFKGSALCSYQNGATGGLGRMFVVINVSPLEFAHCLFIPEPTLCLQQILTPSAIQIGIESVFLSSDPGFRVGFNSLGAFASINHLHLHGYYLDRELRIESASTETAVPEKGLHRLTDFPTGFLFYTEGENLQAIVGVICQLTDFLVERNIAHNLFLTRGCPPGKCHRPMLTRSGVRIIIWPRTPCFGAKEESAFNVALCELAGHLVIKSREDFENITENEVKCIIQKYLLSEDDFSQLQSELCKYLLMHP
ncbi:GDP-D-glucose phosphorylase 1 [Megalops cyprinoides]|uniref:GDP-D-glucose phosphorylase 1 n=1 Tax=Megalops cyprinoides TaxID=118141 RepID=UPI0018655EEA|nr:GDP-D-glucose phosphorylase 1 [Megalops cyprinoides]